MLRRALVLTCAILVLHPNPAAAYVDSGYDPDDRPVIGFDPDIRKTTRRVDATDRRRYLAITVKAYEKLGLWWFMTVRLDSRGGDKTDYIMEISNQDMSGRGCHVYPTGHPNRKVSGKFHQKGDTTRCRAPARLVHPNKRIRWRIVSPSGYEEQDSVTERAPDVGWYL